MTASHDPWRDFFAGALSCLALDREGRLLSGEGARPSILLPGAFNPVHEGHWGLAAAAERQLQRPVAFELSVVNVDKPALDSTEVLRRVKQFHGRAAVCLTRAATFLEKARLFPGAVFAVGADTAARVLAPRYYGHDPVAMMETLTALGVLGCRFLVAGRVDRAGKYVGLADLPVPPQFDTLFTAIPRSEFQLDISSTDLRGRALTKTGSSPDL